ncbi:uncharacterized protein Dvar_40860 [Desulfosarcina variabilis str. Montpellier]|uniref:WGR domain-containing protein n=1 Tax=Desulfosarcina variabilis TaxID=2300 RepID=UPI003AFB353A
MMKVIDIHLECTEGTSNKYWHGQVIRTTAIGRTTYVFNAHYGRIGATGQETNKAATTVFNAFNMLLTKLKEKVKKGYVFRSDSIVLSKKDREYMEKDLEVALSRFSASAQSLPGWIPPAAITKKEALKTSDVAGKYKYTDMKKSSPASPASKVVRKAMITI